MERSRSRWPARLLVTVCMCLGGAASHAEDGSIAAELARRDPALRLAALERVAADPTGARAQKGDAALARLLLKAARRDGDDRVRALAAKLLGDVSVAPGLDAFDLLQLVAVEPRALVEEALVESFGRRLAPDRRGEVWKLLNREQQPRTRARLAEALGFQAEPGELVALAEIATDDALPENLRWGAVAGLAHSGLPEALPHLIDSLSHGTPSLRACAREALVELTGRDAGGQARAWWKLWESEGRALVESRQERPSPITAVPKGSAFTFEFLGVELPADPTVICLDCSASMNLTWAEMIEKVRRSLQTLPPSASYDMIAFNHEVAVWRGYLVPARPTALAALVEHLATAVEPKGHTNIFDTLELVGSRAHPDGPYARARQVLLASDGEPNRGRFTEVADILRELDPILRPGLRVNTFALQPRGEELLRQLAERTGGKFELVR